MASPSLRVQCMNGDEHRVEVALEKTVKDLKEEVQGKVNVVPARQRLIWRGRELADHEVLQDAGLKDGSLMHLVERMLAPAREDRAPAGGEATASGASNGMPSATAAVGSDALSSILSQVLTGAFGGAMRGDLSHMSRARASRLTAHTQSMLAHNSNSFSVLLAYLQRTRGVGALGEPSGMHPILPPSQAALAGRSLLHFGELTRAVVHALDACAQPGDADFVAAYARVAGAAVPDGVAQRLRALMVKAREEAERDEARLRTALAFLENPQRFAGEGVQGAERVEEADMAAARAIVEDGRPREDASERVRDVARWLEGRRVVRDIQGARRPRTEGGPTAATRGEDGSDVDAAYEFHPLALVAFVLLASDAAAATRRYQDAIAASVADMQQAVLTDLDAATPAYPGTRAAMDTYGTLTHRAAGLHEEMAYTASLHHAAIASGEPDFLASLTPVALQSERRQRQARAALAAADAAGAPEGSSAATAAAALAAEAEQPAAEGDAGAVGAPGHGPRWRVALDPRFEVLLSESQGPRPARRARGGAGGGGMMQTINFMGMPPGMMPPFMAWPPDGGDGERAQAQGGREGRPTDRARSDAPATGGAEAASGAAADAAAGESDMQVEGLPIFVEQGAQRSGSLAAQQGAPAGIPLDAFPGMPGFAMMPGGDGDAAMGSVVLEVGIATDGGPPTVMQTSNFGDMGALLRTLLDPERAPPRGGGALASHPTDVADDAAPPAEQPVPAPAAAAPVRSGPPPRPPRPTPFASTPAAAAAPFSGGTPPPAAAATPRVAQRSPSVQSPHDLQAAMHTLATNLSRDLDTHRSQNLSDDARQHLRERISLEYLQQVPELMATVAPRAGASIQSRGAGPAPPPPARARGEQPDAASPPSLRPPPDAADAAQSVPADGDKDAAARDESDRTEYMDATDGGMEETAAAAAERAAAQSEAGPSSAAAASTSQPAKPKRSPRGLGGGLKRRKGGRSDDGGKALAAPAAAGPSAGGSAAANPLSGLMAAMAGGAPPGAGAGARAAPGGPGGAGGGGGDGFASLMQSMMPMVNNMLGGGGGGAPGAGPAGLGAALGGARPRQQQGQQRSGRPLGEVLKAALGAKEGKEWLDVVKKDRKSMAGAKRPTLSDAYKGGQPPAPGGGGLL